MDSKRLSGKSAAALLAFALLSGTASAAGSDFDVPEMSAFLASSGAPAVDGALAQQEVYVDQDGIDVYKEPVAPKDEADVNRLVLTQLRRGEKVRIVGETKDGEWYKVRVNRRDWDSDSKDFKDTEGWVRRRTQLPRPLPPADDGPSQPPVQTPIPTPSLPQPPVFIVTVPVSTPDNPALPPQLYDMKPSSCRESFVQALTGFLRPPTPYVWGGTTHRGVDCSGLVVASMLEANCVKAMPPRTAAAQQRASIPLSGPDQLQKGDLIFFGNPVHHVIVYIGDDTTIEAPHTGAYVTTRELHRRIAVKELVRFGSLLPKLER